MDHGRSAGERVAPQITHVLRIENVLRVGTATSNSARVTVVLKLW